MKLPIALVVVLSLGISACHPGIDGWRRPAEDDVANQHALDTCKAEANGDSQALDHCLEANGFKRSNWYDALRWP